MRATEGSDQGHWGQKKHCELQWGTDQTSVGYLGRLETQKLLHQKKWGSLVDFAPNGVHSKKFKARCSGKPRVITFNPKATHVQREKRRKKAVKGGKIKREVG